MQSLDQWFLQQELINSLLAVGESEEEALKYSSRIIEIAVSEESEHQSLHDPFDRSVALVFSLVKEEAFNPWAIDLESFLDVFTQRVKEGENLDLPACGRLIRLSWEVLKFQSESLLEKIQHEQEVEDWEEELHFGWEAEYDDEAYFFTQSILNGDIDHKLPQLFNERVRRDEGRPVTLSELLIAFKDAADDAESLKLREENRRAHEEELSHMLSNVDGRMHNEDLEGDIQRCWMALKETCKDLESHKVPLFEVIKRLHPILQARYGLPNEEIENEAFIASFIAGLFLTHRRMASMTQEGEDIRQVELEDLWPNIDDFSTMIDEINQLMATDSDELNEEKTGYELRMEALAERARIAAEKAAAKQIPMEVDREEPPIQPLMEHDWLIE